MQGGLARRFGSVLVAADLVGALDGRRQFTVFAPTDTAFETALGATEADILTLIEDGVLDAATLTRSLHASGSIPFVLTGERDIPGAPAGQYWDGGIIDYHFDLGQYQGDGLILYPHFRSDITPGWFDKFLPWRQAAIHEIDNLVLLCPGEAFVADLPFGKIPDRSDFTRLGHEERVRYWEICVARSAALAEEFAALVDDSDPLRGATLLR